MIGLRDGHAVWGRHGEARSPGPAGAPFWVSDFDAQLAALRQGVGMTVIPCFVGDGDPLLARVPGTESHPYGTLWLLTQGETRKTRRVRLLSEFIAARLAAHTKRLAGSLD